MDLSNDMLIDLGLNIAGFLVAAGLMLVGRSIFSRSSKPIEATPDIAPVTPPIEKTNRTLSAREPMDVITFGNNNDVKNTGTTEQRRNRAEVIRIAREMIASGTSTDKIRSTLPLSEAELAVLSYER